jgi:single-strand DNA-binding protein
MKLELIGNLGKDCTVNEVNGSQVINFSVAHSEKVRDKDNNFVDKTRWVECAYWTDKTNVANYLKKGTLIYMEGKPEAKTYLNDKTKETVAQLHARVTSLQLLSSKSDENQI